MKNKRKIVVKNVEETINAIIPRKLQEEWDNSGLLLGFLEHPVRRILTCLDLDDSIADEATGLNVDMIVTHHPLIFNGISSMRDDDPKGNILMRLIRNEISVYSSHTPFDKVKGGNNDILAKMIGLVSVKNLLGKEVGTARKMIENCSEADIARQGKFKEIRTLEEAANLISDKLGMQPGELRIVGDPGNKIKTVGICTGAGADMLGLAKEGGCDLLLTGDVKYHEAQIAQEMGMCMIDAGHYHTEKIFANAMKELLESKFGDDLEIIVSKVDLNPFAVV